MTRRIYFFRMQRPLAAICDARNKSLPKVKVLEQLAREHGLPFYPDQYPAARDGTGSIEDGLVYALSVYLGLPAKEFVVPTDTPPDKLVANRFDDWLLRGAEWISQHLNRGIAVPEAAWCTKEQKLVEAVTSLHEMLGHLAKGEGTVDQFVPDGEAATTILYLTADQIGSKVLEWKKYNEATTLLAFDTNKTLIGLSTILPLTTEAYERVRSGGICDWELTTNDLDLLSTNLLLFAFGEWSYRSESVTKPAAQRAIFRCLLAQLARFLPKGMEGQFRALGMATHGEARSQLLANGFKGLSVCMPGTVTEVHELTMSSTTWSAFPAMIRMARTANHR